MRTKTIIEWEVGDTVEVANNNHAPQLEAGAKCVVIRFTNSPRVRQTSPNPEDDGIWWIDATDLRPWQPGYGYMPSGERVPEPPEGWELVPEGEDIGKGSRAYVGDAWAYSLRNFGRAEAGLSVRAYARFKQPAEVPANDTDLPESAEAEAEIAELRKDKARLDWVDSELAELVYYRDAYHVRTEYRGPERDTVRGAIDAAMEGGAK